MKKWCMALLAAAVWMTASAGTNTSVSVLAGTADPTTVPENAAASASADAAEEDQAQLILDDKTATVQITEVFEIPPDKKDMETENPMVGVSFSVTNHGEKEIVMDLRNLKVGETPVIRLLLEGDIIAPGATTEYRYGIIPDTKNAPGPETAPSVTLKDILADGISGEIHLVSMEGDAGQAAFSFTGDQLPPP